MHCVITWCVVQNLGSKEQMLFVDTKRCFKISKTQHEKVKHSHCCKKCFLHKMLQRGINALSVLWEKDCRNNGALALKRGTKRRVQKGLMWDVTGKDSKVKGGTEMRERGKDGTRRSDRENKKKGFDSATVEERDVNNKTDRWMESLFLCWDCIYKYAQLRSLL